MHTYRQQGNRFEVVFVPGDSVDKWHVQSVSIFTTAEAAAEYVSYLNGGGQPRASDVDVYVQGQGAATDASLQLLLASSNPALPAISVRAVQVTNRDRTADVAIILYEGNSTNNPIATCGANAQTSNQYNYTPGLRSRADVYFACSNAQADVYVSAQGVMLSA